MSTEQPETVSPQERQAPPSDTRATPKMAGTDILLHNLPEECLCAIIVRLPLRAIGYVASSHRSFALALKMESTLKQVWYAQKNSHLLCLIGHNHVISCAHTLGSLQMPSLQAFNHLSERLLPGFVGMDGSDRAFGTW